MPLFLKLGDVKGESTDDGHKSWINIDSINAPVSRSIPRGATDQDRARGETTLHDLTITHPVDISSPKIQLACAVGTFYKEVEIHLCTTVKGKQEPFLKILMQNVIVTSCSLSGGGGGGSGDDGEHHPTESFSLNFTEIHYTYVVIDPDGGGVLGSVPAKYNAAKGRSS